MKFAVFAVYDTKAAAFLPPFVLPERGMAIRTFSDCVNDSNHQFGQHPEDYTLFHLATWTDHDGVFDVTQLKEAIHNGVELLARDGSGKGNGVDPWMAHKEQMQAYFDANPDHSVHDYMRHVESVSNTE